jgi:NAD-dependent SIR2 family protein deacetylase
VIAKCECQQCGQPVEFEAAQLERTGETPHRTLGQTIDCPHCKKPTQLYLNRSEFISRVKPVAKNIWWVFVLIIGITVGIVIGLINCFAEQFSLAHFAEGFFLALGMMISLLIYFSPSIVGHRKKNSTAIFILNLLAGWTFIGWVGALVWACTKD